MVDLGFANVGQVIATARAKEPSAATTISRRKLFAATRAATPCNRGTQGIVFESNSTTASVVRTRDGNIDHPSDDMIPGVDRRYARRTSSAVGLFATFGESRPMLLTATDGRTPGIICHIGPTFQSESSYAGSFVVYVVAVCISADSIVCCSHAHNPAPLGRFEVTADSVSSRASDLSALIPVRVAAPARGASRLRTS